MSASPDHHAGGSVPRVVLLGPPGSGKTVVGALLAEALAEPFHDSDALLTESHGGPTADLLIERGEEEFRRLEAEAAEEALALPGVAALGSGALDHEATAERVAALGAAGAVVAHLDVSLSVAAARLGLNVPQSPALAGTRSQLAAMATARRPRYEARATVVIDTSELSPEEVVARLRAAIS
ncbi:shikimate kinase [Bogoriella caseilytica]|uniref:Shikimate kinase n=1 Tax=Bogoriella caseilytica TaxID=56055 RepID=A0A3N2B8U6_9MICO|nr:shikimate kinase [Bogoriella caseilytica]ROR71703.1 shikimate kinase [Bogoriella caseilytica]